MAITKLYSKSGKLKGTYSQERGDIRFTPINSRKDYYAADREDFLAKLEQGQFFNSEANEWDYAVTSTPRLPPPVFFTVHTPPSTLDGLINDHKSFYLMDGNFLVPDERRDGRTKVASVHNLLVTSKGEIGGYLLDLHYVATAPGRYKAEMVSDILGCKEYIFYSPEQVLPKHKGHTPTGQVTTYQHLVEAVGPDELRPASGPGIAKHAAIRCLWEALGGRFVVKLTPGDKGVYLNTAVTNPLQIAFLVAAGYNLFLRTSAANRRKDYFAVKGS